MKKVKGLQNQSNWDDNPEWTEADFKNARPVRDVFPDIASWSRNQKRKRARKGEPVKKPVSIRLSPEVLIFFKSKGKGWQTRIDETLLAIIQATK